MGRLWAALFFIGHIASSLDVLIPADDVRLTYGGRWASSQEVSRVADWPCSDIRFHVEVAGGANTTASLPLIWSGRYVRLNVTAYSPTAGKEKVAFFQVLQATFEREQQSLIKFPPGNFSVMIRKLSTSAPFGTGLGEKMLKDSKWTFFGLGQPQGSLNILASSPRSRQILAIGASDTAGWCVDGTPSMQAPQYGLLGWHYENCAYTYSAQLGRRFDADVSVAAISGIGLTQNSNSHEQWIMGALSMPDYFNRTVQNDATPLWNFSSAIETDLVLVSLGGNDYNHQKGRVPSNQTFTDKFEAFTSFAFEHFSPSTHILAICGMGSPLEKNNDPDNNRCRPCPHVEQAVTTFKLAHPSPGNRLHYKFVPCDGSVITGQNDIGCNGHKNRFGQAKVAQFLAPTISSILNW